MRRRARQRLPARHPDGNRNLPGIFQCRGDPLGRLARRHYRPDIVGPASPIVLYAAFGAGALGELSQVWGEVSQASGAAERLFEILRLRPQIAAPLSPRPLPQPPRGDVAFENVRFAYPTRPETFVADGVSLSVRAGERIAIVGPSGAGKSTLFHLLLRAYDPLSGTVSFDGVALQVRRSALNWRCAAAHGPSSRRMPWSLR